MSWPSYPARFRKSRPRENPRPSVKAGKLTTTVLARSKCGSTFSRLSSPPTRSISALLCPANSSIERMLSSNGGGFGCPPDINKLVDIECLFEAIDAGAPHRVDKAFIIFADFNIMIDHSFDPVD